jgi:multidrug transporter EmrE-like cation transporter
MPFGLALAQSARPFWVVMLGEPVNTSWIGKVGLIVAGIVVLKLA